MVIRVGFQVHVRIASRIVLYSLTSQNRRMDVQLGYGVILTSCYWFRCLIPLLSGRWGNSPKFGQKCDNVLIWRAVITNVTKIGRHSVKRGIIALHFGEKLASLLLPIFAEDWRIHCTSFIQAFKTVARFTIVRQMAPL